MRLLILLSVIWGSVLCARDDGPRDGGARDALLQTYADVARATEAGDRLRYDVDVSSCYRYDGRPLPSRLRTLDGDWNILDTFDNTFPPFISTTNTKYLLTKAGENRIRSINFRIYRNDTVRLQITEGPLGGNTTDRYDVIHCDFSHGDSGAVRVYKPRRLSRRVETYDAVVESLRSGGRLRLVVHYNKCTGDSVVTQVSTAADLQDVEISDGKISFSSGVVAFDDVDKDGFSLLHGNGFVQEEDNLFQLRLWHAEFDSWIQRMSVTYNCTYSGLGEHGAYFYTQGEDVATCGTSSALASSSLSLIAVVVVMYLSVYNM